MQLDILINPVNETNYISRELIMLGYILVPLLAIMPTVAGTMVYSGSAGGLVTAPCFSTLMYNDRFNVS
jgi:hypothetical protein